MKWKTCTRNQATRFRILQTVDRPEAGEVDGSGRLTGLAWFFLATGESPPVSHCRPASLYGGKSRKRFAAGVSSINCRSRSAQVAGSPDRRGECDSRQLQLAALTMWRRPVHTLPGRPSGERPSLNQNKKRPAPPSRAARHKLFAAQRRRCAPRDRGSGHTPLEGWCTYATIRMCRPDEGTLHGAIDGLSDQ